MWAYDPSERQTIRHDSPQAAHRFCPPLPPSLHPSKIRLQLAQTKKKHLQNDRNKADRLTGKNQGEATSWQRQLKTHANRCFKTLQERPIKDIVG